jgi:hypothetical protein
MDLRENHREVNRIRRKVVIDEVTIGRVRGALWQGKEVGSEEDMSISMVEMRRSMEKSALHRTLHGDSTYCSCVIESFLAESRRVFSVLNPRFCTPNGS